MNYLNAFVKAFSSASSEQTMKDVGDAFENWLQKCIEGFKNNNSNLIIKEAVKTGSKPISRGNITPSY
jgi:hypothetical protein